MKKVDFFIVGAAKAGTSSLFAFLDQHPDVCMSKVKEPNYFTHREIAAQGLYYKGDPRIASEEEYLTLFDQCPANSKLGEASVSYLFYPETAARIKNYNPDAKIIIVLRDPVSRGFSHYLMDKRLGLVKDSFAKIVREKSNPLFVQQYIELGMYAKQIQRYLDHFPREQVLILLNTDFKQKATEVMHAVYTFLGVSTAFEVQTNTRHNSAITGKNALIRAIYSNTFLRKLLKRMLPAGIRKRVLKKTMTAETETLDSSTATALRDHFYNDIKEVEHITGLDLSNWKVNNG